MKDPHRSLNNVVRPKNTMYLYYDENNKIISAWTEDPSNFK